MRSFCTIPNGVPQAPRRYLWGAVTAGLLVHPISVIAQVWPPAGDRERELGQIIRQAGYVCPLVASIDLVANPPPGWEVLRPEVAVCVNGKKYLVATSGRSGGNVRPVVRPML